MFRRKNENQIDRIKNEYNKHINSKNKIKEYDQISALYKIIRNDYIEKIQTKGLDINIERIQIEKRLGRYSGFASNYNITFYVGFACAMLPIFAQALSIANIKSNYYINFALNVFSIVAFLVLFGRIMRHDNNTENMLNICLKVLEDIEREVKENKERPKNKFSFDEVAATTDRNEENLTSKIIDNKGIKGLINIISITKIEKNS